MKEFGNFLFFAHFSSSLHSQFSLQFDSTRKIAKNHLFVLNSKLSKLTCILHYAQQLTALLPSLLTTTITEHLVRKIVFTITKPL